MNDMILSNCFIQVFLKDIGLLKFYIPRIYVNNLYKIIFEQTHLSFNNISASIKNKEKLDYIVQMSRSNIFYYKTSILFFNNKLFKAGETYINRVHPKNSSTYTVRDIEAFRGEVGGIVSAEGYITGPLHNI